MDPRSSALPPDPDPDSYSPQHHPQQEQQVVPPSENSLLDLLPPTPPDSSSYLYPYLPNLPSPPAPSTQPRPLPFAAPDYTLRADAGPSSHHAPASQSQSHTLTPPRTGVEVAPELRSAAPSDTAASPSFHGAEEDYWPEAPATETLQTGTHEQLAALIDAKLVQVSKERARMAELEQAREGRTYRITAIQRPTISAAFEDRPLSRVPLAPPLILQLDTWNTERTLIIPFDELPFFVCHLTLETTDGREAMMVDHPRDGIVQMLYGTLVAMPSQMVNQVGEAGVYFCFPDVSVRYVGQYRLKCSMYRLTGGNPVHTTYTDTFTIIDNSDYVAPDMTQHFHNQGLVRFGLYRDEW